MKYSPETQKKWDQLLTQIAGLTKPKCDSACLIPNSCCSPEYCDMAIEYAASRGVTLERTNHQKLPLMGEQGCTAPPHLRPLCSLHVCESHLWKDPKFCKQYMGLREALDLAEDEFYDFEEEIRKLSDTDPFEV